jgi:Fur family peroxide stress response transcriptional regulator
MKKTPQRLAILNYLKGNKTHPSAIDIYKAISKKFPTMSLATVYNALEALRQEGLVKELHTDPKKKRFDPETAPHNHAICMRCGLIQDLQTDLSIEVPADIKDDFDVKEVQVEFYGVCKRCRKRMQKSESLNSTVDPRS